MALFVSPTPSPQVKKFKGAKKSLHQYEKLITTIKMKGQKKSSYKKNKY